jgi:hypothetical protein
MQTASPSNQAKPLCRGTGVCLRSSPHYAADVGDKQATESKELVARSLLDSMASIFRRRASIAGRVADQGRTNQRGTVNWNVSASPRRVAGIAVWRSGTSTAAWRGWRAPDLPAVSAVVSSEPVGGSELKAPQQERSLRQPGGNYFDTHRPVFDKQVFNTERAEACGGRGEGPDSASPEAPACIAGRSHHSLIVMLMSPCHRMPPAALIARNHQADRLRFSVQLRGSR